MSCDFCGNPAYHTDRTRPFALLDQGWETDGHWSTCHVCHKLIAANERKALLARTLNANIHATVLSVRETSDGFRILLDAFWENKL